MTNKVKVTLQKKVDNSYEIIIGSGTFDEAHSFLATLGNKFAVVVDSNTRFIGESLVYALKKDGHAAEILCFAAGEQSKNMKTVEKLLMGMQGTGLDRKSMVVAVGGGVVGDMAGLCAAMYMRGIGFVQVPTSLLAMVDSSIGGKVAVDLASGKNMAGSFYQPKKVIIDVALLKTLPDKEMGEGLAELIKHALIMDKGLFATLEKNIEQIKNKHEKMLIEIITKSCKIKADVVMQDETEQGKRKILNYGHTIGHALEVLTSYRKFSHGEAIAIGMAIEGLIATKTIGFSVTDLNRQNKLLIKAGLPIKCPPIDIAQMVRELSKDKKAIDGKTEFALLEMIGKARFGIKVPESIIREAIGECR